MNQMNSAETSALVAFLEQSLQCFAVGGSELTGTALVAGLDPEAVTPELAQAYLKLRAA
jgi:hypothetical protein